MLGLLGDAVVSVMKEERAAPDSQVFFYAFPSSRPASCILPIRGGWGGWAHHTLNNNTCCCSALISGYTLYANTVCHHSVLLGSVSRVRLMVRCFKNSLGVRTENNSSTPLHNLLTILWASSNTTCCALLYKKNLCLAPRQRSYGSKQNIQDVKTPHICACWVTVIVFFPPPFTVQKTLKKPRYCDLSPPPTSWTAALKKA